MLTLREARKNSGLRPEEVAVRMDVSVATLYAWESGRIIPKKPFVIALASLYGVDVSDIIIEEK